MYYLRTEISQSNLFAPVYALAAMPAMCPCVRHERLIEVLSEFSAEIFGKPFHFDFDLLGANGCELRILCDALLSQSSFQNIEAYQQMIGTDWTLARQRGRWYPH